MTLNVILFPNFETLDVFGPVGVFGKVDAISIHYYSLLGGLVSNADGVKIETLPIAELLDKPKDDTLIIPGGMGTRIEVNNLALIGALKMLAQASRYVLTVCTGSALLAKTGLLDARNATSNKGALDWVMFTSNKVHWQAKARWVVDGKFYTSSGITAGMDMALGFVSDVYGKDTASQIAHRMEYNWNSNKENDLWGREIQYF